MSYRVQTVGPSSVIASSEFRRTDFWYSESLQMVIIEGGSWCFCVGWTDKNSVVMDDKKYLYYLYILHKVKQPSKIIRQEMKANVLVHYVQCTFS